MVEFTRRKLMATSVAAGLGASVPNAVVAQDDEDGDTPRAPHVKGELKRFSSTALGAEVTGPFVFEGGTPLYSLQHPSRDNETPYNEAGVGYFSGFQFTMDGNSDEFDELSPPRTNEERGMVRGANADFTFLAHGHDPINGGTEELGVAQTPDGTNITTETEETPEDESPVFEGTLYGDAAYNPDCNQFVATNEAGTEGYLFTNWENSPGNVSRIPICQTDAGEWEADLENAINLANTDAFRELGGTRINCYGDLSPWDTMISSEENYAHPRVSTTATVGDIVEAGSGEGLVGGAQFWNRPNPNEIQEAVDGYYGDDSWELQGYWALTGVEFLAYYLGAGPVDEDDENTTTPIDDVYPSPYRYGYHVDFREPTADPPQPIKYHVMGRTSWEAPDIQCDLKTVYGCSDGDNKGIYKFVADEEIPSYDDPMELSGTLYAPLVMNDAAAKEKPPADVSLEIEWLPIGHASNAEVERWIAAYDDVTQVDYLETHAADWSEGDEVTDAVLEEADREVVENGNQNYITNEEILEWTEQYESDGYDDVDEELRKVPFLETRAAAKEVGATIEFRKAEGVDSVTGAGPGDYVYFGISELNDDMSDDEGDIRIDRVDGGVVYRGQLDANYNVSTLEPVIVGPDGSDPADVADDALLNIDNVYVMDDGRVLCCEDAAQFGRSYSNDCMYVYTPEEEPDASGGKGTTGNADESPEGNGTGEDERETDAEEDEKDDEEDETGTEDDEE